MNSGDLHDQAGQSQFRHKESHERYYPRSYLYRRVLQSASPSCCLLKNMKNCCGGDLQFKFVRGVIDISWRFPWGVLRDALQELGAAFGRKMCGVCTACTKLNETVEMLQDPKEHTLLQNPIHHLTGAPATNTSLVHNTIL